MLSWVSRFLMSQVFLGFTFSHVSASPERQALSGLLGDKYIMYILYKVYMLYALDYTFYFKEALSGCNRH